MGKGDYLGEFEQLVLLALVRLRDNAYGMTIRQELQKRTGRDVAIGAVYATLTRLEEKGYALSRLAPPTPERGGRAKRYFVISAPGVAALNQSRQASEKMWSGIRWAEVMR